MEVFGSVWKTKVLGILNPARCSRQNFFNSSSSTCCPSTSSIKAQGVSPHFSSGRATTAAKETAGCFVTTFSISTTRKVNGNSSGLIKYVFTESNGVCRVYRLPELVLGTSTNDEFGIWAYGDNSNNQLQFWFRDGASQNQVYNFGVINWTGWKLLTVPMSEIGGTGEKKFHSVVIKKNAEGKEVGELYFDDLQIGVLVSVDDNNFTSLPIKFELNQNYPNPFNPTTSIEYSVPSNEYVSLKVYDILGNEIAVLVNEQKSKGNFQIEFNAENLPSGTYFYKLTSGSYTEIKKMMLMKTSKYMRWMNIHTIFSLIYMIKLNFIKKQILLIDT